MQFLKSLGFWCLLFGASPMRFFTPLRYVQNDNGNSVIPTKEESQVKENPESQIANPIFQSHIPILNFRCHFNKGGISDNSKILSSTIGPGSIRFSTFLELYFPLKYFQLPLQNRYIYFRDLKNDKVVQQFQWCHSPDWHKC